MHHNVYNRVRAEDVLSYQAHQYVSHVGQSVVVLWLHENASSVTCNINLSRGIPTRQLESSYVATISQLRLKTSHRKQITNKYLNPQSFKSLT